jgi:hypothetical protein
MELGYEKLMRENNLTLNDLNEDARNGIANVKAVMIVVNRESKKGKSVSDLTWSKVRTNDKWICGEILETLDGKHRNNEDEAPHTEQEIIEEIEEDEEIDESENVSDLIGIQIDSDFDVAFKSDNTKLSLEDIKSTSPTAYDIIWKTYKANEKNGITTTFFNLIETEKHIFTLTKK